VLVILGLLVGGVLTGKELIRAAEFRKIATDVDKYIIATRAFKDKYFALPGDFNQASRFWGTNCDVSATVACNGNSNGIANKWGDTLEYTMYWRHLSLAGLIDFGANGSTMALYGGVAGNNIPGTALRAGIYVGGLNGATYGLPNGDYNFINVSLYTSATPPWVNLSQVNWSVGLPWTNQEAKLFDQKYDDGNASSGRIWGGWTYWMTTGGCKATATGDYNLSASQQGCQIVYVSPF
jgi:hypothetical protein